MNEIRKQKEAEEKAAKEAAAAEENETMEKAQIIAEATGRSVEAIVEDLEDDGIVNLSNESDEQAEAEAKAAEEKAAKEAEEKAAKEAEKKAKAEADKKAKEEAAAAAAAKKKAKPASKEVKKQEELKRVKSRAKSIDFKVLGEATSSKLKTEVKKGATRLDVAGFAVC